jgi:protein CLEC16A
MLKFVGDRTAVPYFSNLVWFIGNHVLEIDQCMRKQIKDQQMLIRLDDLVAEHLDHLHYLNDILHLQIEALNEILTDHLLNRLLIPLYIYSLVTDSDEALTSDRQTVRPRISSIVSLFLLSQVFLIISYESLVQQLVNIILNAKCSIFDKPQFEKPVETLEESLCYNLSICDSSKESFEFKPNENDQEYCEELPVEKETSLKDDLDEKSVTSDESRLITSDKESFVERKRRSSSEQSESGKSNPESNVDLAESDLYQQRKFNNSTETIKKLICSHFYDERPFLKALFQALESAERDDHASIFSLCLIYAIVFNAGNNLLFFSSFHFASLTNFIIPFFICN